LSVLTVRQSGSGYEFQPESGFASFAKYDAVFAREFPAGERSLGFLRVRPDRCGGTNQLPGDLAVCSGLATELDAEPYRVTREDERSLTKISSLRSHSVRGFKFRAG